VPYIAAALGAFALAALFFFLTRRAPEGLGLQAHEVSAGQVRIEWNRGSPALAGSAGVLEIDDGGSHLRVPLSVEQLQTSSITYAHQSPRVSVRLRVERSKGPPLEETIAYDGKIAPAPAPPSPQPAAVAIQPEPPKPVAPQAAQNPDARRPAQPEIVKTESTERAPGTASPVAPLRRFAPPAPPTQQARPVAALPGPPALAPGAASAPALPLPAHVPVAAPPPRAPAYAGPRSGRLIWTGDLARRGVVEVDGSQASVGVLAGALPGVPVSIRVSPAQFTLEGLVVYTADASRNGRSEPASAVNGWNRTRFEWDPQRSREIAVLEWPNPSNQYKRLALRNDARSCAVIVIEWNAQ
jgi:hypothetical protein